MPNPADLLSEEDDEDPDDQLRMQLDQGQGANLAGGPMPPGAQGAMPPAGGPSPNVPGPLAALAPAAGKPHITLKTASPAKKIKPHITLKTASPPKKIKPKIRAKSKPGPSSALQNFLSAIATNPGS